ncbi:MAG: PPC domain-containing DNA-binding protein, partial [Nitrospinota bacterium]
YQGAEGRIGRVLAVRLAPGCDLVGSIREIAQKHGVKSGFIMGACSLRKVTLRNPVSFPDPWPMKEENRTYTTLEQPMELTSMAGNIGHKENGELVVHLHANISLGSPDGVSMGGHIIEGAEIFSTGEIVIMEAEGMDIKRVLNDETKAWEFWPVERGEGHFQV